jgi:solute carrier family 25 (mitochondrial iron transporter), member 28/37
MSPSTLLVEEDPLEFEEWDGKTPFWHHCLAGSFAGVAEHVLVYPLDTVKTHIQCATCPVNPIHSAAPSHTASAARSLNTHGLGLKPTATAATLSTNSGLFTTMRHIVSQPAWTASSPTEAAVGYSRLWRGVHTVMIGCIPAHALYFSSYESVKYYATRPDGTLPYWAGLAAGAAAVLGHDVIMSPLDTIKQRLQLGHYTGMRHAVWHMIQHEGGVAALYRSFPVTLLTNVPYGSIMVSTNEICKEYLSPTTTATHGSAAPPTLAVCLVSSAMGGMVASFVTTPLDRIKTMLQVQELKPAHCERYGSCPKISAASERVELRQAIRTVMEKEGILGLFKGSLPRILSHTPAVAISWTTYETAKQWLAHL